MTNQAYIINEHNELVAPVKTELKSGAAVQYSFQTVTEFENGETFQGALVNKRWGKISRAKKWAKKEAVYTAETHQFDDEFLIS